MKSSNQQAMLMLHRARELIVRQRTMIINTLRGHFAELGIVAAQGTGGVSKLIGMLDDSNELGIPDLASRVLRLLVDQLTVLTTSLKKLEAELLTWHRTNEAS